MSNSIDPYQKFEKFTNKKKKNNGDFSKGKKKRDNFERTNKRNYDDDGDSQNNRLTNRRFEVE